MLLGLNQMSFTPWHHLEAATPWQPRSTQALLWLLMYLLFCVNWDCRWLPWGSGRSCCGCTPWPCCDVSSLSCWSRCWRQCSTLQLVQGLSAAGMTVRIW